MVAPVAIAMPLNHGDLSKFGRLNGINPFCSDWVIRNAESKLALRGIGSVRYQTLKIAWKVERQNPLAIHRIASGSICQKISLDRISTTVRRALARPPRNCQYVIWRGMSLERDVGKSLRRRKLFKTAAAFDGFHGDLCYLSVCNQIGAKNIFFILA